MINILNYFFYSRYAGLVSLIKFLELRLWSSVKRTQTLILRLKSNGVVRTDGRRALKMASAPGTDPVADEMTGGPAEVTGDGPGPAAAAARPAAAGPRRAAAAAAPRRR
jgi:hypothetical protein